MNFNELRSFSDRFVFSFKRLIAESGDIVVALFHCESDLTKKDGTPLGDLRIKGVNLPKRNDVLLKVDKGFFNLEGSEPVLVVNENDFHLIERKGYFKKPIYCKFKKCRFYNDKNGYTIAEYDIVNSEGYKDPDGFQIDSVAVIGNYLPVEQSVNVTFESGEWVKDKKGRWQIKTNFYKMSLPDDDEGILRYLSNLPGCGEVTAKKILKEWGSECYDIIEHHYEDLTKLKRVSLRKAKRIQEAHLATKPAREIIQFLGGYGVTVNKSVHIFEHYSKQGEEPEQIMARLQHCPFTIIAIDGFGFRTADNIAKAMKLDSLSAERIREAILYVLKEDTAKNGHVFSKRSELIEKTCKLLNENPYPNAERAVEANDINKELSKMVDPLKLVYKEIDDEIYLRDNYYSEVEIAKRLIDLLKSSSTTDMDVGTATKQVKETVLKFGFTEAEKQEEAAVRSLTNKVSIITGGPGTGKTSIIRIILDIYKAKFPKSKVRLCAPTGRAAQRMSESTGHPASTIHRMLGLGVRRGEDDGEPENPIKDVDLIIVDECSMIDIYLMRILLKRIPISAKIIFVGDAFQLPSIGPGAVFNDMIESGVIPTTELNKLFRQEAEMKIPLNAARIKAGLISNPLYEAGEDFEFIEAADSAACEKIILQKFKEEFLNCGEDLDKVQILVPTRKEQVKIDPKTHKKLYDDVKSRCNATTINREVQAMLQKHTPEKISRSNTSEYIHIGNSEIAKRGEKLMQTVNDYNLEVFNGDVGYLISIDKDPEKETDFIARIFFPSEDREVEYTSNKFKNLTLAYASTVHKAQGSEYDNVIIGVMGEHYTLLKRNIIYTAITRAKKKVTIVGSKKFYAMALRTIDTSKRNTHLTNRLILLANDIEFPDRSKEVIPELPLSLAV